MYIHRCICVIHVMSVMFVCDCEGPYPGRSGGRRLTSRPHGEPRASESDGTRDLGAGAAQGSEELTVGA